MVCGGVCVCGGGAGGRGGGKGEPSSATLRTMCGPLTYTGIWQPRRGTRQSVTARIPTCHTRQPITQHWPRTQANIYPHKHCRHMSNHIIVVIRKTHICMYKRRRRTAATHSALAHEKRTIDPSPPFGTQPMQRGVDNRAIADPSRSMGTHPHVVSRWQPRRGTFQPLQGWRHTMGDNHAAQR